MKAPHDYPLTTVLYEQVLELNCAAVLQTGAGSLANGTYGIFAVIYPHSF